MIQLHNIKKSFARPDQGRLEVLKGIDFEVAPGDFVAIVGPSGSGKSTLMNILGLLDRPDEGEYSLSGEVVSSLAPNQLARLRNRRIGFVFQQFHLLPRTTAVENVELPLVLLRRRRARRQGRRRPVPRRPPRPPGSLPEPALGRPAAAGGHRPRPRHRSGS